MREIPKKNYYSLAVLMLATILLTLFLAYTYKNREKFVSNFYNYSNKITAKEFDEYVLESPDLLVYISDRFDITNETFEKKFSNKLDELGLKEKLVFIDKDELKKEFLTNLKENYNLKIDIQKLPTIVVIIDKKVVEVVPVTSASDASTIINYEVFE